MLEGLKGVTHDGGDGTASGTFSGFPQDRMSVAGKTGTAEVNKKADTSLFAAFAPADLANFVAVAILPESGKGGEAAAPLIRRILEPLALVNGVLTALPDAPRGGAFDVNSVVDELDVPASDGVD